jgi:hypothetical protein
VFRAERVHLGAGELSGERLGFAEEGRAPVFCQSRSPALMATTGMPAATAFCSTGPSAAAWGV